MLPSLLKSYDTRDATREQLHGDTPRTTEEIESRSALEVYVVLEDVEEVLLGKVCRRASIEALRDIEATTLVLTADDTHTTSVLGHDRALGSLHLRTVRVWHIASVH